MELKLRGPVKAFAHSRLLIVPYGIETHVTAWWLFQGHLLIVPYGIETHYKDCFQGGRPLLIVPYGIETPLRVAANPPAAVF